MRIKSIMVVGGGSSGSMTAAAIAKIFGDRVKLSILEGKNTSSIGVGESTMIKFNDYLKLLDLKDEDWMKHCDASYKTSVRFTDFRNGEGEVFEYPFGGQHTKESFSKWTSLAAKFNLDENSFCEFVNHNYFLAKYNRLTKNEDNELNFCINNDTAYHFDASLFGKYLRDKFCKNATEYVDDIVSIEKDEHGYISNIVGDSGVKYTADLFIDCTGFKSLLLEQAMESEFCSFKPWLSNDRAIATRLPYTDKNSQLVNVTNCTALSSGWSWNTPLWSRMGTGYVYSSDFIDDDSAEKEFKKYLGTEDVEFRKINIRHGVHEKGWVKNVIGIGLSYGFVEPLEATGLVSTHEMIKQLITVLLNSNLNVSGFDRDGYNYNCSMLISGYKDFVSAHYKLSKRVDTPYWRYQTEDKNWFNQKDNIGALHRWGEDVNSTTDCYYEQILMNHSFLQRWTPDVAGIHYIMAGMGYKPIGHEMYKQNESSIPEQDKVFFDGLYQDWRDHVKIVEDHVKSLPTTTEFLKTHIYN
mgnify:CR=1 FL=1|tara:strand:- start:102 stop:1673 length:1572 start_codon:yes stop_codon:yes gene_type:complete